MLNPKIIPAQDALIKTLKNELPVLRARMGLSQESLSEKIGISRQTYSAIETGKRKMTWTVFWALVGVFMQNEQTCLMLKQVPGFSESINQILNDSNDTNKSASLECPETLCL